MWNGTSKCTQNVNVNPENIKDMLLVCIDRLGMLKYGINDLRAFFETDYRWLNHLVLIH